MSGRKDLLPYPSLDEPVPHLCPSRPVSEAFASVTKPQLKVARTSAGARRCSSDSPGGSCR
eukprot:12667482-Alexandrium_andersonii.AAC.1